MNAREWTVRISDLARRESSALIDLLLAVAEFDAQEGYRQLGFSSLFDFLHRKIGLSRGSAYYRQVGARLVRRFPEVAEPIRTGQLCITTVSELAKVLTEENQVEVLPRFFGCSRQEAKQLVAELRPVERPTTRTVVTEVLLPVVAVTARTEGTPAIVQPVGRDRTHPEEGRTHSGERPVVVPMTVTVSRLHITVSREFLALLKKAKAGQSHLQPGATDEQVLTAALELLVEKQSRRRASVPPKVKREVMKRDGGKCTWPLADGGTCGATTRLQVDHVVPRGRGGPSTTDNCRVLCQSHNLEAARGAYGDDHMNLFAPRSPVAQEPCAPYGPCAGYGPPAGFRPGTTPTRPAATRSAAASPAARPSRAARWRGAAPAAWRSTAPRTG